MSFEPREGAKRRYKRIKMFSDRVVAPDGSIRLQYNVVQVECAFAPGERVDDSYSFSFCMPPAEDSTTDFTNVPVKDPLYMEKMSARFQDTEVGSLVRDPALVKQCNVFLAEANPLVQLQTGCRMLAKCVVPPGGGGVSHFIMSWCHAIPKTDRGEEYLFLPTFNDSLDTWMTEMYTLESPGIRFGTKSPEAPGLQTIVRVTPRGDCVPCTNYHIYLDQTKEQMVSDRRFLGTTGCRAIDSTVGRRVSFFESGMMTVPVVCGCFLFDSERFGGLHVPILITERMSRFAPVVFSDYAPGSALVLVELTTSPGVVEQFVCDPENRHEHQYVRWCQFKKK